LVASMPHSQHPICQLVNDLLAPIFEEWREGKRDDEDDVYDELRV
jgi:hypothetical protein